MKGDKHGVSRVLAQNVELTLEVLGIERATARGVTVTVVGTQNDERLKDGRLLARRGGTENGPVRGDLSPAENTKAEVVRDLGENSLLLLKADGVVRLEENITDGVLACLWELATNVALSLTLEEKVRNAGHDTRTVAIAAVCAGSAAVGHGAEELASIGDDLVALVTLDVADEADTACVLFEVVHVEALVRGQGSVPRRRVALYGVEAILRINLWGR